MGNSWQDDLIAEEEKRKTALEQDRQEAQRDLAKEGWTQYQAGFEKMAREEVEAEWWCETNPGREDAGIEHCVRVYEGLVKEGALPDEKDMEPGQLGLYEDMRGRFGAMAYEELDLEEMFVMNEAEQEHISQAIQQGMKRVLAGLRWEGVENEKHKSGAPVVLRLYKEDEHLASIIDYLPDNVLVSDIPEGKPHFGYHARNFSTVKEAVDKMEEFALGDPKVMAKEYEGKEPPLDKSKVTLTKGDLSRDLWVSGKVNDFPGFEFSAKVFDAGSRFGIDHGRVSKLHLFQDGEEVMCYQRGWAIGDRPWGKGREEKAALKAVLEGFPDPQRGLKEKVQSAHDNFKDVISDLRSQVDIKFIDKIKARVGKNKGEEKVSVGWDGPTHPSNPMGFFKGARLGPSPEELQKQEKEKESRAERVKKFTEKFKRKSAEKDRGGHER